MSTALPLRDTISTASRSAFIRSMSGNKVLRASLAEIDTCTPIPNPMLVQEYCTTGVQGVEDARLHVAPVLATDLEEQLGDLLQGTDPGGVHEHDEDVFVVQHGLPQPVQGLLGLRCVAFLEALDPIKL